MTRRARLDQQRRSERRIRAARHRMGLCIDCEAPHRAIFRRCAACRALQRQRWHERRGHLAQLTGAILRAE